MLTGEISSAHLHKIKVSFFPQLTSKIFKEDQNFSTEGWHLAKYIIENDSFRKC